MDRFMHPDTLAGIGHQAISMPGPYKDFEYSLDLPKELLDLSVTVPPPIDFYAPTPDPIPSYNPLFDESEQAVFGDFLDTLAFDNSFLFNPILPCNLPSLHDEATEDPLAGLVQEPTAKRRRASQNGMRKDINMIPPSTSSIVNMPMAISDTTMSTSPILSSSSSYSMAGSKRKNAQIVPPSWPSLPPSLGKSYTLPGDMSHLSLSSGMTMEIGENSGSISGSNSGSSTATLKSTKRVTVSKKQKQKQKIEQEQEQEQSNGLRKDILSEAEKRRNHILSEQRRRNTIREGFRELTELVPTLTSHSDVISGKVSGAGVQGGAGTGGQSKSTILLKAVEYIEYLQWRTDDLQDEIEILEDKWKESQGIKSKTATHSNMAIKQ